MRKLLPIIAAAGLAAAPLTAHDFWLQPQSYWVRPGQKVPMSLLVGHGADRQRSGIAANRITLFRSVGPGGVTDRTRDLTLGNAADASMAFAKPGTHVVYFATTNALSDLPAARFNEYAEAEGLSTILAQRLAAGKTDQPGREYYSRRGKAIVQVGPPGRGSLAYLNRPIGMELEIVPLSNPYAANGSPRMVVAVHYWGRPLAGALVKLTNLDADAKPTEMHRTNKQGHAIFKTRTAGQWQYNVVWSRPLVGNVNAEFETVFASLTFGFPAQRPARALG